MVHKRVHSSSPPPPTHPLSSPSNAHRRLAEAESKEKHSVWDRDSMSELAISSSYVCPDSRVDSNTFTMGNPMPESTR
jgi:hypothetical protein